MDPKLAWGQEVFPGGGEGRGLTSPLRQKQALEDDDVAKGPRYGNTNPLWGDLSLRFTFSCFCFSAVKCLLQQFCILYSSMFFIFLFLFSFQFSFQSGKLLVSV